MRNAVRILAAAIALSLSAVASPALAVTTHATYPALVVYRTALVPQPYGAGEYAGVLNLTIAQNGIVSGYYRPEDVGQFTSVTGGLDGDHIWLDLGRDGLGHLEGTFSNGKIVASTFVGNQVYAFTATPQPN